MLVEISHDTDKNIMGFVRRLDSNALKIKLGAVFPWRFLVDLTVTLGCRRQDQIITSVQRL